MPRGARLDAPGVPYDVMVRGIERRPIFQDDGDRTDFVARLAAQAEPGTPAVYAWALLPNHVHLLVRTGSRPLARSMRSLLTPLCGGLQPPPPPSRPSLSEPVQVNPGRGVNGGRL
jgi:putative transposase